MLTAEAKTLDLRVPDRFTKGQALLNFLSWVVESGKLDHKLTVSDPATGAEVEIANLAKIPDEVFDHWWRQWVKLIDARKDRR